MARIRSCPVARVRSCALWPGVRSKRTGKPGGVQRAHRGSSTHPAPPSLASEHTPCSADVRLLNVLPNFDRPLVSAAGHTPSHWSATRCHGVDGETTRSRHTSSSTARRPHGQISPARTTRSANWLENCSTRANLDSHEAERGVGATEMLAIFTFGFHSLRERLGAAVALTREPRRGLFRRNAMKQQPQRRRGGAERTQSPQRIEEPKPPFPEQHQDSPGRESELDPAPRYQAEAYRAAAKLEGKVALITGGDSGIGRAVALLFAREGACRRDQLPRRGAIRRGETRSTRSRAAGGECLMIPGDLSDAGRVRTSSSRTPCSHFGKLDILVSNAAYQRRKDSLDDLERRGARAHVQHEYSTRTFGSRAPRCEAHETGRRDHRDELGDRHLRLRQAARLFGDQGRDQRVHENARASARSKAAFA